MPRDRRAPAASAAAIVKASPARGAKVTFVDLHAEAAAETARG